MSGTAGTVRGAPDADLFAVQVMFMQVCRPTTWDGTLYRVVSCVVVCQASS